jgi:hypothetical protein
MVIIAKTNYLPELRAGQTPPYTELEAQGLAACQRETGLITEKLRESEQINTNGVELEQLK